MALPSLFVRATGIGVGAVALLASVMQTPALAASAPRTPTGLAPSSTARVTGNPVLSWKAASGATRYHVDVSTNPSFTRSLYSTDTSLLHATPTVDLPLGRIYWRVRGISARGTAGASASRSFTRVAGTAPMPLGPVNGARLSFPTSPPVFSWTPVAGAKSYLLEIDDAPDFVGATQVSTVNTSYVPTDTQTVGQRFYWHVQAMAGASNLTGFSATRSYTVAWPSVPTLFSPADGNARVRDVNFTWSAVPGAAKYELQVSPNGDWANNRSIDVTVKGTRYSPPITLDNSSYFWRVRAMDAKQPAPNYGGWSAVHQFTRIWSDSSSAVLNEQQIPQLVTPTDGSAVGTPEFSWTPVAHASQYLVEVSTDPSFTPISFPKNPITCLTDHTSVTPYLGGTIGVTSFLTSPPKCTLADTLTPGVTYYWRVRGLDTPAPLGAPFGAIGVNSVPSAVHSFTYLGQGIAHPLAPADGSSVSVPTLKWTTVPGAQSYEVTVTRANGTPVVSAQKTASTSFTPTTVLRDTDGPFTWNVRPIDRYGKAGLGLLPGDQWSFSVHDPAPTTSAVVLTPATLGASTRMPAMSWTPVTGAKSYRIYYVKNGIAFPFSQFGQPISTPYAAFTSSDGVLAAGTYGWFVSAYGATGLISNSPTGTFTIATPAPVMTKEPQCVATCADQQDTPTLRWSSDPAAAYYTVYLSIDRDFTNNNLRTYVTAYNTLRPIDSLLDNQAGQSYYWQVVPCTPAGCAPFDPTTAATFRKRSLPVTLVSPAEGAKVADLPTFSWQDYLQTNLSSTLGAGVQRPTQEARQYHIQVSTAKDFSTILDDQVVDQTTYTPFGLTYPEGPLYWRVQAIDGTKNQLTWSPTRSLRKFSSPVLAQHPVNGAKVTSLPYFRWSAQPFAAAYEVEVYQNSDRLFSPGNRVQSQRTKQAAWSPTAGLPAGGYAWRVRRLDADSRPGPWSAGSTFTLSPTGLALSAPLNGQIVGKAMLLRWSPVQGAASYGVEVSPSSSFSQSLGYVRTVMTAYAPTSLSRSGRYYWRVTALDGMGNLLRRSGARSFVFRA